MAGHKGCCESARAQEAHKTMWMQINILLRTVDTQQASGQSVCIQLAEQPFRLLQQSLHQELLFRLEPLNGHALFANATPTQMLIQF